MRTAFRLNTTIVILNLILSLVSLFLWFTQSYGFRLYILQDLYNSIDKSGIGIRSILLLLIAIGSVFILFRFRKIENISKGMIWGMISVVIGLFIGLVVFYAFSCCESLITFNLGFPLSWLHAVTKESSWLSLPEFQYLIQNLGNMHHWYIDGFSLLADLFFWYIVGLAIYVFMIWFYPLHPV